MKVFLYVQFIVINIYLLSGIYILLKNPKELLNRLCASFVACFFIWSIAEFVANNPDISERTARISYNIGSIGWIGFISIYTWMMLVFAGKRDILKSKALYPVLFCPPILFIYLQWSGHLVTTVSKNVFGWFYIWDMTVISGLFIGYYLLYVCAGFVFCFKEMCIAKSAFKKNQAAIILSTSIFASIAGSITNLILPAFNKHILPNVATCIVLIWVFGIIYAMVKYKFLTITPEIAAEYIISSMGECLLLLDPLMRIVRVNAYGMRMLNYAEQDLIQQDVKILFSDESRKTQGYRMLCENNELKNYDFSFTDSRGEKIPVILTTSIIKDSKGDVSGTICIARDISDRIKNEQEKEKLQEQIIQSDKLASVGEIAAGIAHEINTPLNVILGYQELMQKKIEPGSPFEEYVKISVEEVEFCRDLIREFLVYAQPTDSDKLKQTINIPDIVRDAHRLLLSLKVQNVNIKNDIDEGIPHIYGDHKQMMQVFVNLINNAVQAMPGGGDLTISVKHVKVGEDQQDGGTIEFRISDTGEGIPEENIRKVFNPFFTTKRPGKGTGLGLAVCVRIMENHKGTMRIESKPGEGTTVIGQLPVGQKGTLLTN